MKVAIIMSTYNGEMFVEEQIKSVLAQKKVDIDLYIRDDGSKDNTVSILKEFKKNNSNIFLDIDGSNIGFMKSFIKTLIQIEEYYDYYAFCDQDDYWEDNKIYEAIKLITNNYSDSKIPIVYYSNLNMCDENLNFLYITKLEKRKQSLESCLLRNSIAGCTMLFNNSFFNVIKNKIDINTLDVKSHDLFFISICYSLNGEVICDANSYIKYRKHNNNASGSTNSILNRIKKEIKSFYRKGEKAKFAKTILNLYDNDIKDDKKKVLLTFSDSTKIKNRLKILFSYKYSTGNIILTIYSKIKAVCGLL